MVSKLEARVKCLEKGELLVAHQTLHRTHRPVRPTQPARQSLGGHRIGHTIVRAADTQVHDVDVTTFLEQRSSAHRTHACVWCQSIGCVRCEIEGSRCSLDPHRTHAIYCISMTSVRPVGESSARGMTVGCTGRYTGRTGRCVRCNINCGARVFDRLKSTRGVESSDTWRSSEHRTHGVGASGQCVRCSFFGCNG